MSFALVSDLEGVQPTAVSSVLPLGMLGRSITGYRVTGLDDNEKNAALVAQTIAGDPHTFTAELGGIVSLVLAGVERPEMGLSATAYFPQAVREHLHAPVRWWMTDAQANFIRARKHRIDYGEGHPLFGEPIKVSGTHPSRKKDALIELGSNLYDQHIHRELSRSSKDDRGRVLVVANSYQQCAWLARGIARAGRYDGGLCLAVRAEDLRSADPDLPRSGGTSDPSEALTDAGEAAWQRLALLLRTAPQFTAMHKSLQDEVVAGMIVDLIQLAGRARRGGTDAVLHMVDYALHEDTWSADLETVLRRIHSLWPPEVRQRMNDLCGE